jgi:hypothetical protein
MSASENKFKEASGFLEGRKINKITGFLQISQK